MGPLKPPREAPNTPGMNDRRGGRRLPLLLSTCLLLALASLGIPGTGAAQGAGAKASAGSPESLLFVQTASKGRLHRNAAGRLILSLKASRWTQKFTDRPQRKAGVERTSGFIGKWARRGFRADPPNAALSIDRPGGEVMSLELKRPRVSRGWLHYSVKRLKGSGKVRLGRFGTASLFIDNAKEGLCFGFGAPCFPGFTPPRMILIFETPSAYSVNFNVTLSGDSASFSPNQLAGGYTGVGYNGPNSVTVSVNAPYDDPEYVPVVVQGAGEYEVTTSIPVSVAPDNYSYVPVGPNTPVTYSFGN
jgi:hypothetical protein